MQVERVLARDLGADFMARLHSQSLYTSPSFLDTFEAIGGSSCFWVCRDGECVVAAIPVVEFGSSILQRGQALPDGLFCVPYEVDTGSDKLRTAIGEIFQRIASHSYLRFTLSDYFSNFKECQFGELRNLTTQIVSISSGYSPPDSKLQAQIRKALAEGVSVRTFDEQADFGQFQEMLKHSDRQENRTRNYPMSFFKKLAEVTKQDSRILWLVACHASELVATHIYFIERQSALHWFTSSDRTRPDLKMNQLLTSTAISLLHERGVTELNLGGSPDGAESLVYYKKRWGGVEKNYASIVLRSRLGNYL